MPLDHGQNMNCPSRSCHPPKTEKVMFLISTISLLCASLCLLSTVDFVAVVMPPGAPMAFRTTQVKAYAYPGKKRSVYRSNRASEVSVQVHEFGHNNGLSHSGKANNTYGDRWVMQCMCTTYNHSDSIDRPCSVSAHTLCCVFCCFAPNLAS